MNHLIHAHDVTKRVTRIGEPISGTYKTLKGGSVDVEYTPSLPGGAGFIEATIYSKFDEHNNSIIVKYNGYCFYLEKTVIGFPIEYVVIPFTVVQYHKYVITVTVNPDWTCQLALDGVGALPGLGAEYIANAADREFSADTGFWGKISGCSIAGGKLSINWASLTGVYSNQILPAGIPFLIGFDVVDYITGTVGADYNGSMPDPVSGLIVGYKSAGISSDNRIRIYTGSSGFNGSVDNATAKQIQNSTTTQAPTYRGHLGG